MIKMNSSVKLITDSLFLKGFAIGEKKNLICYDAP